MQGLHCLAGHTGQLQGLAMLPPATLERRGWKAAAPRAPQAYFLRCGRAFGGWHGPCATLCISILYSFYSIWSWYSRTALPFIHTSRNVIL